MARPKTKRGRGAPRLPPINISKEEEVWALSEVTRTGKSLTQLVRNRFFASMPGYKP